MAISRMSCISIAAALAFAVPVGEPAQARTLQCQDYGTYVTCDNGRSYSLSSGGSAIIVPPSSGGVVVVPQNSNPVTISKDEERDMRKILRDFERNAWRECLNVGSAASGERKQCQRTELRRLVDDAGDRQLKHYFETQYRFR